MKEYFTVGALLAAIFAFSQQAGKAGELLKNEAGTSEMRTQSRVIQSETSNSNNERRSVFIDPHGMHGQKNSSLERYPQYNWNQNFGYSEVFLRIPEGGHFTVEIGDQQISNSSGKFRFFDLRAGSMPISIYEGRYLIYRTRLNVQNYSRMVLDFFSREGLYLLDTVPVRNQTYGFNEWDDVWNNPYNNGNWNGYGNSGYYGNVMSNLEFNRLVQNLRMSGLDSNKMRLINSRANGTVFSSQQIYTLVASMMSESNRLQLAKMLYTSCADKQNYHTLYSALLSNSSRQQLQQYINRM